MAETISQSDAPKWYEATKQLDQKYSDLLKTQQNLIDLRNRLKGSQMEKDVQKQIDANATTISQIEALKKTLSYSWDAFKGDIKTIFNMSGNDQETVGVLPLITVAVSGATVAAATAMIVSRLTESKNLTAKIEAAKELKAQGFTDSQIVDVLKGDGDMFSNIKSIGTIALVIVAVYYGGKYYVNRSKNK